MTDKRISKINDLIIEEPIQFPMTKDETIILINETLEMNKWSVSDLADGREIEVFKEWHPFIEQIVWDYRNAGWRLWHFRHGNREYLSFENPAKQRFNQQ